MQEIIDRFLQRMRENDASPATVKYYGFVSVKHSPPGLIFRLVG